MAQTLTFCSLLVEDNPADADLMREVLELSEVDHELHVVKDGEEALAYLRREGDHSGKPRPALLLLDLNLPRKNGHEVLAELRADPKLRTLPVLMLTSSESEKDIDRSYELGANAYVTKPIDFSQFEDVVESIERFWVKSARLPNGNHD